MGTVERAATSGLSYDSTATQEREPQRVCCVVLYVCVRHIHRHTHLQLALRLLHASQPTNPPARQPAARLLLFLSPAAARVCVVHFELPPAVSFLSRRKGGGPGPAAATDRDGRRGRGADQREVPSSGPSWVYFLFFVHSFIQTRTLRAGTRCRDECV